MLTKDMSKIYNMNIQVMCLVNKIFYSYFNSRKEIIMRLRKKVAAMVLAGAIIAGHSVAALAALAGFAVSTPSLVTLNGKYVAAGGVSYNSAGSSGSLYLQDMVYAYAYDSNGLLISDYKAGYGWNAASAATNGMSYKPFQLINVGSYKSGASFTEVGREIVNVK